MGKKIELLKHHPGFEPHIMHELTVLLAPGSGLHQQPIDLDPPGRRLLEKTYLKNAGAIIEQHHERLDGSGYPKGLKSTEILLEAKIIAVADSFDAMTSFRSYRSPSGNAEAIAELKALSGEKYDRHIVDILEEILKEEGKL